MRRFTLVLGIIVLSLSCVEVIDLIPRTGEDVLVVEGVFTTKIKHHEIKLSYTTNYPSNSNVVPERKPISSALVEVISNDGEVISFYESAIGTYSSVDEVGGEIGKEYHLRVVIDDKEYESVPEIITPVTRPDSLYYEYIAEEDKIAVYIETTDPANEQNFYRWSWNSNYIVITNFGDELDCCARCFISKEGNDIVLYEDTYSNGQPIKNKLITKIPVDIKGDYLIFINQMSISLEAYEYYHLLQRQLTSTGNLFDPPPSRLIGNLTSVSGQETVLGYFSVSDEKTIYGQIERAPYFTGLGKVSRYGDCRLLTNSDTITPQLWNTKFLQ